MGLVGCHIARHDAVEDNALVRDLLGYRASKADTCSLVGGVVEAFLVTGRNRGLGDNVDRPTGLTSVLAVDDKLTGCHKHTGHVDGVGAVPLLKCDITRRLKGDAASNVVHQAIDPTPLRNHGLEELVHGLLTGCVKLHRSNVRARCLSKFNCVALGEITVVVGDDNRDTLLREHTADSSAYALGTTGDDDNLLLKSKIHAPLLSSPHSG